MGVAALMGFVALSNELLWYRLNSFALAGRAQVFGLFIGGYLFGLACGAAGIAHWCRAQPPRERLFGTLAGLIFAAAIVTGLMPWAFGLLVTLRFALVTTSALTGVGGVSLGAIFPLLSHIFVRADERAGAGVAGVYAANITGAALGSLLTGLVLLDLFRLQTVSLALSMACLACAAVVARIGSPKIFPAVAAAAAAIAVAFGALGSLLNNHLYEKLLSRRFYRPEETLAHVVENASGVIAVDRGGAVFGGGAYDGAFNVDLKKDASNAIHRAYFIGALHPAPRAVLSIGLSSGSWAAVLAAHPAVQHVTLVEINRGYLELLPFYPGSRGVTAQPNVTIEIADGRRWLFSHPDAAFDLIVANTTYPWRANATGLVSSEFFQLVRRRLKPGGVLYINSTGDDRVQRTAMLNFAYGWRIESMVAASDAPLDLDFDRARAQMARYEIEGRPALDLGDPGERALLDRLIDSVRSNTESREQVLARTSGLAPITDDNMGTEWALPERFRIR